jgi:very-short-patch-repair endonuclease
MQFVKGKIEDRGEWKAITSKPPTDFIIKIWESRKLEQFIIKFFANLVEYDVPDIEERYNKYINIPSNQRKGNSIENYTLRYGEVEGIKKFNEKVASSMNTLDRFISRYGKDEGEKKYKAYCLKKKDPKANMINRYGLDDGLRRYEAYCEKNKGNLTLKRKIEQYGEELGLKKFNEMKEKFSKSHSLEGYRSRHGYEEGGLIYFTKMEKLWKENNLKFSRVSQELFKAVESSMGEGVFLFNDNGGEHKIGKYWVDFYYPSQSKIIEFYGDNFHANPSIYTESDRPHPFTSKLTSADIWKYDKNRLDFLINGGNTVLVVWEKDYRKNKEECIELCVNFLKTK